MRPLIALIALLLLAAPAPAADQILRFDADTTSRSALKARLGGLGLDPVVLRKLPFARVSGDAKLLRRARRLPGVVSAHPNEQLVYELERSAPLVFGGAEPRGTAYRRGFDGRGVNVAVVDTGTDGLHPDLMNRVVRNVKVFGTEDTGGIDESLYVECPTACNTDTTGGHGTHVSGIAVGDGTASQGRHRGVAPGAGIVGLGIGEAAATFDTVAAYDYLLLHPELKVAAVNNSFGKAGGGTFDAREPINVGTKALNDAGIAVVFSAGNYGPGSAEPAGSSDCSPTAPLLSCKSNPYSVAPWAIGVANARKDHPGEMGDQPLSWGSSRGDDQPQVSVDGAYTIDYRPTLTAPGTNIISARDTTGTSHPMCAGGMEVAPCIPTQDDLFYSTLSGTSMAAPHVVGAIAVIQSAAEHYRGKRLSTKELKRILQWSATPMTKTDALYDAPCGTPMGPECGSQYSGTTGKHYERWQNGAGALDVDRALTLVRAFSR